MKRVTNKYKRLPKTKAGSRKLESGEYIIPSQQKKLRSLVSKANRIRKKLIEALPPEAMRKYKDFGVTSDFIYRKKSARLTKFRTKDEFKSYIKQLERITQPNYQSKLIKIYRHNYNRALANVFNSEADSIIKTLNKLSDEEFYNLTFSDALEDVGYVYNEPVSRANKLAKLNKQIAKIKK